MSLLLIPAVVFVDVSVTKDLDQKNRKQITVVHYRCSCIAEAVAYLGCPLKRIQLWQLR